MADYGLRQLVNEPTKTKGGKTCIDLIFTNIDKVAESGVLFVNLSDHFPVYMLTDHVRCKVQPKHFKGRSYKNYDKNIFCNRFKELAWDEFDGCDDVKRCWKIFSENIDKILNIMCPVKDFRTKFKEEPWLTPELIAEIIGKKIDGIL